MDIRGIATYASCNCLLQKEISCMYMHVATRRCGTIVFFTCTYIALLFLTFGYCEIYNYVGSEITRMQEIDRNLA